MKIGYVKITFVGVGEAFDPNVPNTSILVDSKTKILLDCGYSVPQSLWKVSDDPDLIDAIYISHFHADHYFGLPAVIARMWEGRREKDLTIIGQSNIKEKVMEIIELGYRGFPKRFRFDIKFQSIEERVDINELSLSVAPTSHSIENIAVRVESANKSVCYSGDGISSQKAKDMYEDSVLIHDSYLLEKEIPGVHPSIKDIVEISPHTKKTYLVHINRDVRKDHKKILQVIGEDSNVSIPETHQTIEL